MVPYDSSLEEENNTLIEPNGEEGSNEISLNNSNYNSNYSISQYVLYIVYITILLNLLLFISFFLTEDEFCSSNENIIRTAHVIILALVV